MWRIKMLRASIAFAVTVFAAANEALATTVAWNVDSSGFWDVAANWSTGKVPQPGEDVVISRPGASVTVTFRSGTATINTLTCDEAFVLQGGTLSIAADSALTTLSLTGGTLNGAGNISVSGLLTWSGGIMSGSGATNANAGMQINNAGTLQITDTRTINLTGVGTWAGAGSFSNGAGATFNNLGGSTFNVQSAGDFLGGTFNNAGTLAKVAGGGNGDTRFTAALNNTGTLTVTSGTLQLDGGGMHSGSFTVVALAVLQFGGGTHTLSPGTSVSGGGEVEFAGGTTNINAATYDVNGTTAVSGGTTTFAAGATVTAVGTLMLSGGTIDFSSGEPIDTPACTQTGGTLGGSDKVSVGGLLAWSGGIMSGAGVTNANGTLQITASGTLQITGSRTINNAGAATWTGAGSFSNGAGATFNNLNGATFTVETNADFLNGTFNNAGTVDKEAGGGDRITRFTGAFNNSGAVEVNGGVLQLDNGGVQTGGFTVQAFMTLQFGGGTHTLNPGASVSGAGVVDFAGGTTTFNAGSYNVTGTTMVSGGTTNFNSGASVTAVGSLMLGGGTINLNSGEAITSAEYTQSGGTLGGTDIITVPGLVTWSGGVMAGNGVLNANGGMEIGNAGTLQLTDNRTVNNSGSATWIGAGSFSNAAGATFNNLQGATFVIQTAGDFLNGTLNNAGTITKLAGGGDGDTRMTAAVHNAGTLEVQSGTLQVNGGYTQTGGTTRLSGGTLKSSQVLNITAGRLEGSGLVDASVTSNGDVAPGAAIGTLQFGATYTQGNSGSLEVEIGGLTAGTQFDQIAIAGAAALAGTLHVRLVNGFTPNVGDAFEIMRFASRSGDFQAADGVVIRDGIGFRKIYSANHLTLQVVQEICLDGQDNDGDGLTDCDDPKCAGSQVCMGTPTSTRTATFTPTPTATRTPTNATTVPPTPTSTLTRTATLTAVATASGTIPFTATPTPTQTPKAGCVGDCNGDGEVTVDELIKGVNIALGSIAIEMCPVFDVSGNGEVEINELIVGVSNALNGCPVSGTPTPTPIGGPSTATATAAGPTVTPGDQIQAVAGSTTIITNAMSIIPSVIGGVVSAIQSGGSAAELAGSEDGGGAGNCPLGGTAMRTGSFPFPLNLMFTLSQCKVATADGTVTYQGSGMIQGTNFAFDITAQFDNSAGMETLSAHLMISGTVGLSPSFGACLVNSVTLTVTSGTLSAMTPLGTQVGVTFQNTTLIISNITFSASCVPTIYRMTFNGSAALLASDGDPVAVTFNNFLMDVDNHADPTTFVLAGGITSQCFGGAASLGTTTPLAVPSGAICPTAGRIGVNLPTTAARIGYLSDMSVAIDDNSDGTVDRTFPNCLDPRLLICAM